MRSPCALIGVLAILAFGLGAGCSDSDDGDPAQPQQEAGAGGANGGAAGSAGNAGTAGTAGNAGSSGTAGNAGAGGTAGNAGAAGAAGTAGSAGAAGSGGASAGLVIDHTTTNLGAVPASAINQAKSKLHIVYQHTSHGSQLITGMEALQAFPDYSGVYAWDDSGQNANALDLDDYGIPGDASDLSTGDYVDGNGDTPWVVATRALLNNPANSHVNVVLWSWCSINGHDAQRYIDNMEKLIAEFPSVVFPFMTGHAEGQGLDLTANSVHYNNELIRAHAKSKGRWLFDFADIESYDPEGQYYWDKDMYDNLNYDGGNWAQQWCTSHAGSELEKLTTGNGMTGYSGCHGCAHSDSPQEANLNCVLKGRAAWYMWARIAGWNG